MRRQRTLSSTLPVLCLVVVGLGAAGLPVAAGGTALPRISYLSNDRRAKVMRLNSAELSDSNAAGSGIVACGSSPCARRADRINTTATVTIGTWSFDVLVVLLTHSYGLHCTPT